MGSSSWTNAPVSISVEVGVDANGKPVDYDDGGKVVSESVAQAIFAIVKAAGDYEVSINALSSGYYDPGKLYGPPENCYPPDGEDERLLDDVVVYLKGKKLGVLPQAAAEELFDQYQDEINNAELPAPDYDGPDYDDDRD